VITIAATQTSPSIIRSRIQRGGSQSRGGMAAPLSRPLSSTQADLRPKVLNLPQHKLAAGERKECGRLRFTSTAQFLY
jgi:hypothetical protein